MIYRIKLFTLLIALIPFIAKADFSDIATIKVNGTLIRKVINNTSDPYLINLSAFKVGDTLSVFVKTDMGIEDNSIVTIKNLVSGKIDTFNDKNQLLLTNEVLKTEHLISVVYINIDDDSRTYWDICKIIPNPIIEEIYYSANLLGKTLLSLETEKGKVASTILQDSILIGYKWGKSDKGSFFRIPSDTISYSKSQLWNFVKLSPNEKKLLRNFDSKNYMMMDDYQSQEYEATVHIDLNINENELNKFQVVFGTNTNRLVFDFKRVENQYKLELISIKK